MNGNFRISSKSKLTYFFSLCTFLNFCFLLMVENKFKNVKLLFIRLLPGILFDSKIPKCESSTVFTLDLSSLHLHQGVPSNLQGRPVSGQSTVQVSAIDCWEITLKFQSMLSFYCHIVCYSFFKLPIFVYHIVLDVWPRVLWGRVK